MINYIVETAVYISYNSYTCEFLLSLLAPIDAVLQVEILRTTLNLPYIIVFVCVVLVICGFLRQYWRISVLRS